MMAEQAREEPIVFDAHPWCEYALDGPQADLVAKALESAYEVLTPSSVVAELKEALLRHGFQVEVIQQMLAFIKARARVVSIDVAMAEAAGDLNFQRRRKVKGWGMLDSFVNAVALLNRARILTGDAHFRDLPGVLFIGEEA